LFCQRFSYNPPGSRARRQEKQSAIDRIFATVDSYAPNFSASIVGIRRSAHPTSKKNSA
jgi:hypothetical protein